MLFRSHRKRVPLAWFPPWVYALLLLNLGAFLIGALITQKKSAHWINLCDTCIKEWRRNDRNRGAALGAFLCSLVGAGVAAGLGSVFSAVALGIGGPILSIAGYAIAKRGQLTAQKIDKAHAQIRGTSPAYAQQMALPSGGLPSPPR